MTVRAVPADLPEDGTAPPLSVVGRLVQASNGTYLVDVHLAEGALRSVYKPVTGERPLWDFPSGTLAAREVAAYRLSREAGFHVVPQTVLVADGPAGRGSLQRWVDHEGPDLVDVVTPMHLADGWHAVLEGVDEHRRRVVLAHADSPALRRLALFDVLVNNADRKGAHVLAWEGRALGVDQGLCFHEEYKLRTVLWGWADQPLTAEEVDLVRAAAGARDCLATLLSDAEIAAFHARCEQVLADGRFPAPSDTWPAIPWPPL